MPVTLRGLDQSLRVLQRSGWKNAVTQIHNVANRSRLLENFRCPGDNAVLRAEKDARIQVSLKGNAITNSASRFSQRNAPVHTEHIRSGIGHRFQYCRAPVHIQDTGDTMTDGFEYLPSVRQRELLIVAAIQLTGPGVEELNHLSARFNLKQKLGADRRCERVEQIVQHARFAESEGLDLREVLRAATFNHI